jgi:dihydropyrimidine dehydrogenase (NAD+) subunit PreA
VARLVDGNARRYEIIEAECVGCNLCEITCPVEGCISMVPQDSGKPYMNWTQDPRNPRGEVALGDAFAHRPEPMENQPR